MTKRRPWVCVALLLLVAILPTRAQSPQPLWMQVDAAYDVWQIVREDGSQDFIELMHPASALPHQGAAWGGRIGRNGNLSNWFMLEYVGRTANGVEVVLRQGQVDPPKTRSFKDADDACSTQELAVKQPVCRARAIAWGILDGGGGFQGPGTRTLLSTPPFQIPLRVADPPSRATSPALMLTFEDGGTANGMRLILTQP